MKGPMNDHDKIVLESHERSRQYGVQKDQINPLRILNSEEVTRLLDQKSDLIGLCRPVMMQLYDTVKESGFVIFCTDAEGCILHILGDEKLVQEAEAMGMVVGAYMNEQSIGTNAMGTALNTNVAVQITANEHFSDAYHRWTCSAAPVHNTSGEIIATINLTGHRDQVHPHTLGMVVGAVQAIESRMESLAVQKQLFDANQYAFTLMNNLTFGVFAVDLNDEIHWVNDTACTSLGIRRIHLLNRPIIELFPDWAHVKRRVLLGEVFIDEEGRFLINKMTEKFMYNSYPIKTPEGEILGFMLTIREYRRMLNLVNRYTGSHARYTFSDIIGTSVAIQQLLSYAKKVALSPSSVLIIGESGTGKEVFAQAIHNASERREGAFVAINCGAIAPTLIESELFGYEEGAFTGARKGGRPGKFELADKGTLFLDEIGEMPLEMQVKLLRTIQEGSVTRIGGEKEMKIDVRIIAATNKDLAEEVRKGRFRLDLYYRLNVIPLRVPPLRERKEDIKAMVKFFLKQKAQHLNKNIPYLTTTLIEKIMAYSWPGNIRELENFLEKAVILDGNITTLYESSSQGNNQNLPALPNGNSQSDESALDIPLMSLDEAEKAAIERAITKLNGNISKAARVLNVSRNTLYLKMKKYGIPY